MFPCDKIDYCVSGGKCQVEMEVAAYRARVGLFAAVLYKILVRKAVIARKRVRGMRMHGAAAAVTVFTLLLMLLMAGVEPNPGPGATQGEGDNGVAGDNASQIEKLCTVVADLSTKIVGLSDRVQNLEQSNTTRVSKLERQHEMMELDVECVNEKCGKLETVADSLSEKVDSLQQKLTRIEGENRRRNLLFFGLPKAAGETWDSCEQLVLSVLKRDLRMAGPVFIDRARRVGAAILVTFQSLKQRDLVLSRTRLLAEARSPVFIREDYPEETRQKRAGLVPLMKQLRDDGVRARLRNDKLVTDDTTYIYNLDTKQYTQMSPRKREHDTHTHSNHTEHDAGHDEHSLRRDNAANMHENITRTNHTQQQRSRHSSPVTERGSAAAGRSRPVARGDSSRQAASGYSYSSEGAGGGGGRFRPPSPSYSGMVQGQTLKRRRSRSPISPDRDDYRRGSDYEMEWPAPSQPMHQGGRGSGHFGGRGRGGRGAGFNRDSQRY